MTPALFLALSLAGGIGAATRLLLDGLIKARTGGAYPWGTTVINVTGSLLLGLITGLALAGIAPEPWRLVLGTGFLGGYTTFSTASLETVRLLAEGRQLASAINALGTLLLSVIAAATGLWLGGAR
ncbi:fluoride efflux transporter CrcB [Rathayibacter sp. AY1G1]|jgi:CrcB protein|uniref:fluoride efflux transporter CrcB n=1 Tax=unclassified Rathayibacter TaxID=2609250 RepID=UPI000CE83241|nr:MULTISPECIES: fluoride efflux transporter CrcB [unclassified Rathayibacter]PPF21713.1 fluoride efflux transporter CrcB [Rathayibacter sp. AY1A7]PPF25151.1 fluoride efflux transporter CrcB [Rathayibacter sp. AY1F2]PPF36388.1 fluoride efflux transporter CrcB [Rathayibacter sp. AY1A2]PPF43781.1 fluoride efflux transporter CrcB [Rathayibacter sp. AY1A1]PPF54181.1 fluoride efflux transporter CrcB [Rathayibacter sp. AY1C2]